MGYSVFMLSYLIFKRYFLKSILKRHENMAILKSTSTEETSCFCHMELHPIFCSISTKPGQAGMNKFYFLNKYYEYLQVHFLVSGVKILHQRVL